MYKHQPINARYQEKRLATSRAIGGLVIIGMMIIVLLCRVAYLQIIDYKKYATLSSDNQLRLVPIAPSRGLIYDRNGKLLARNVPTFQLTLIPEKIKDLPATMDELAQIIKFSPEKQQSLIDKIEHSAPYQPISLHLKLTEEQVSLFSVNRHKFPEISLTADLMREYPYSGLLAHILGYVSEVNKEDLTTLDKKRYAGTYQIGKIGLEKQYESLLQGQPGYQRVETDVLGREVRVISINPGTPGVDLNLTIDLNLQQAATGFLTDRHGAIVALDPQNGEILAFVSAPSFDPNSFVQGLDSKSYQALIQAPDRPLYNRVIQGQYPPASTVKPLVALSALAAKRVNPKDKIFDPGWYQIGGRGRQYRDWVKKGHGSTDLEKSIRESCDVYYYILAEKLGINHLSSWFNQIGFGRLTGIDIPGEQRGVVPSNAWKRKTYGQPWFPGETLSVGIGQGYTLITPLQLAIMGNYFANRGTAFRPHFNKDLKPEKLPPLKIDDPTIWPLVIEPMRQVIQHPRGTAYRFFRDLPFDVAGKSGTAQVFNLKQDEKYVHDDVAKHLRDHSLFVAFAPADSPKIVVAIVLENEKASAVVARQMIEAYLSDKTNAEQNKLLPTQ